MTRRQVAGEDAGEEWCFLPCSPLMNKAGAERDMIGQLDEPDVQSSWLEFPGRIKKYRNPSVIPAALLNLFVSKDLPFICQT